MNQSRCQREPVRYQWETYDSMFEEWMYYINLGGTAEVDFTSFCPLLGTEAFFTLMEAVFAGIPQNIKIARYHSLAGDMDTLPECLRVIAKTSDGEIMAVKHSERNIYGFQFHLESVLTEYGKKMLENFLR